MNIAEQLEQMGFAITSHLIKDDFTGFEGQSHWSVTVSRNGHSYTTNYSMGAAHRHYVKFNGRPGKPINLNVRRTLYNEGENKRSKPNTPTLDNVLYCLVSDAQTIEYAPLFQDWAGELGYDTDSIKAKECYDACVQCNLQMRQLCNLDELSELFQDY